MFENLPVKHFTQNVDLQHYPEQRALYLSLEFKGPYRYCTGDLHANVVKALYFLIYESIIALGKDEYLEIVRLYSLLYKDNLDEDTIVEYSNSILKRLEGITLHPQLDVRWVHLCFLGDLFADRGHNDAFMAKMIGIIDKLSIRFDILSSNHDAYFMQAYQEGFQSFCKLQLSLSKHGLPAYKAQYKSLFSFVKLENKLSLNIVQMNDFVKNVYIKHLKLVTYDTFDKVLIRYHHAGIPLGYFYYIANYFGIDESALLCASSGGIQRALSLTYVTTILDSIEKHFCQRIKSDNFDFKDCHDVTSLIRSIHWYRFRPLKPINPVLHHAYNLSLEFRDFCIHGHDDLSIIGGVSLNSMLGKSTLKNDNVTQGYKLFIAQMQRLE